MGQDSSAWIYGKVLARVFALKQLACVAQGQFGNELVYSEAIVRVFALKQLAYEA